jgi:glycosyltransferase involved in cell wall biosynthesis
MPDITSLPFVSFVIPCLNAVRTLDFCLDSIFKVDYPKEQYEVIVVDNGSTDGTLGIVKRYDTQGFSRPGLTVSALRNYGVLHSKGKILAFLDSDCVIQKDWLMNALKILRDEQIGATGCSYGIPENASWVVKAWYLPQQDSPREISFIPSGNLVVPREIFEQVKGFNEQLIAGEDFDFCQRVHTAGYRIIASRLVQAIHLDDTDSLKKLLKKEIWYGKGMLPSITLRKLLNRTVLFCHLFGFSLILLSLGILFFSEFLLVLSSIFLIGIPISSAYYRNYIKSGNRNFKHFILLIPIYFVYYIGRFISLVFIYSNEITSSKKQSLKI